MLEGSSSHQLHMHFDRSDAPLSFLLLCLCHALADECNSKRMIGKRQGRVSPAHREETVRKLHVLLGEGVMRMFSKTLLPGPYSLRLCPQTACPGLHPPTCNHKGCNISQSRVLGRCTCQIEAAHVLKHYMKQHSFRFHPSATQVPPGAIFSQVLQSVRSSG